MTIRKGMAIALFAAGLAACDDDDEGTRAPASASLADGQIVAVLVSVHQGEIWAGQAALTRASDAQVRQDAQRMVNEHGSASSRVQALGTLPGLAPADSADNQAVLLDSANTASLLATATAGSPFDLTYACAELRAHASFVTLADTRLLAATDESLAAEVQRERATETAHLTQARLLVVTVGGGPGTVTPPPVVAPGTTPTNPADTGIDPTTAGSGTGTSTSTAAGTANGAGGVDTRGAGTSGTAAGSGTDTGTSAAVGTANGATTPASPAGGAPDGGTAVAPPMDPNATRAAAICSAYGGAPVLP